MISTMETSSSSGTILIVDDDPNLIRILTASLKAAGYQALVATDGLQAVTAARRQRPDLIILDLGLPGGDGYIVLRRLKELGSLAAIPVIVLSARDAESSTQQALKAGAEMFIQKPADLPQLLASIAKLLGKSESEPKPAG
jgi:two-component system, OmpR family, response regulator